MNSSNILLSIKSAIGAGMLDEVYNDDLIMHINSVFFNLWQLGIGPTDGFNISTGSELWTDFLPDNDPVLGAVKTYMFQKVKLIFDPPQNSFLVNALEKSTQEFEWRGMIAKDPILE